MKIGLLIKLLLGTVVGIVIMILITFSSRFTPFYRDCMKIHKGMSEADIKTLMLKYEGNKRFFFSRESADGPGLYYENNFSGDQCYMKVENGIVTKFMPRFEP